MKPKRKETRRIRRDGPSHPFLALSSVQAGKQLIALQPRMDRGLRKVFKFLEMAQRDHCCSDLSDVFCIAETLDFGTRRRAQCQAKRRKVSIESRV